MLVIQEHITAQLELIDKANHGFKDDLKASLWLSKSHKCLGWKKPLDVPFKAIEVLGALEHRVFL